MTKFTGKKTIVGLDLSLNKTGWMRLQNNQIHHGTIEPDGMKGLDRMDWILERIWQEVVFFPEASKDVDLVVLEGFSFGSRGRALFEIAGLGYLVRYRLKKHGIPFVLVSPSQLKKFVSGVGTAPKSVIIKEIFKRWKFDTNDDNIADACVLAHIGAAILGSWTTTNQDQKKILKAVQNQEVS